MKKTFLILFLLISQLTFAQLKVARLFSDHVVLQRQKPIPVWGWATAKDKITVTLAGQTQTAVTDASGKWVVIFHPLEAGGPFIMTVSNKANSLKINDILIGEVWLCSGQSNMEWTVKQADNFKVEKKNANFPQIRHFFVEHEVTMTPETDLKTGEWKVASEETVGDFTAVGFFFAREIYQKLNIPVGLLHSSWGGSQVEGWISKEGMASNDEFKNYAQNLPNNWTDADAFHDKKVRKQLFGTDWNPTIEDEKKYTQSGYDFSKWHKTDSPLGNGTGKVFGHLGVLVSWLGMWKFLRKWQINSLRWVWGFKMLKMRFILTVN
jgi:sialate O-acetylesterase